MLYPFYHHCRISCNCMPPPTTASRSQHRQLSQELNNSSCQLSCSSSTNFQPPSAHHRNTHTQSYLPVRISHTHHITIHSTAPYTVYHCTTSIRRTDLPAPDTNSHQSTVFFVQIAIKIVEKYIICYRFL